MATTNRLYVLAAFFLSGVAAIFNLVSVGTEEWVHGKTTSINENRYNSINYGLFQGNYKRVVPRQSNYQISMTCSFKHNVCALLCGKNNEEKMSIIEDLYNDKPNSTYDMDNCAATTNFYSYLTSYGRPIFQNTAALSVDHKGFINAGVWICTLIFLLLAALLGCLSSVLALYNTVTNPIQFFLSVGSLYYYNGIALFCTVMSMTLWGSMYQITIFHNVALYHTLVGTLSSDKMVYLGYSYWISFIPICFYAGSIAVLYYREFLNARDPKQQRVDLEDSTDPNIYLY